MKRRPHWDDELIGKVRDEIQRGIRHPAISDEWIAKEIIAAVEDWEKDTFTAATAILAERVEKAEVAMQRVRELHAPGQQDWTTGAPVVCCAHCAFPTTYPCPTIEALDGGDDD